MEIVIRDEAKIVHEKERTERWRMWLPYGLMTSVALGVLAAVVEIFS